METISRAIGWANTLLIVAWALWIAVGLVVGGITLAYDEWRVQRKRRTAVDADAMVAAQQAKQFDRYRFLKEGAGESVKRPVGDPRTS